jgi:hypothetical protein
MMIKLAYFRQRVEEELRNKEAGQIDATKSSKQ